jgi:hypothetical protein
VTVAVPARAILRVPGPQEEREVVVATYRENMRRAGTASIRPNPAPRHALRVDHAESDSTEYVRD